MFNFIAPYSLEPCLKWPSKCVSQDVPNKKWHFISYWLFWGKVEGIQFLLFAMCSHHDLNELLMCFSTSQGVPYNIYASSHTIFLGGEDKRVLDFLDFCCSQCVCYMFPMNFQHVFQVDNSNSFLSHIICWKACSCNLYRQGKREDIDYNYILRVKKHCLGYHSSLGIFSSWANQQGPLQIK